MKPSYNKGDWVYKPTDGLPNILVVQHIHAVPGEGPLGNAFVHGIVIVSPRNLLYSFHLSRVHLYLHRPRGQVPLFP